jgi:hypothetical protein
MNTNSTLIPVSNGPQWIKSWVAFVKGHETLAVVVIAAALTFHFYSKAISAWTDHDKRVATIAQQKVDADTTANAQLTLQLEQMKAQFVAAEARSQAQIAAIVSSLQARQVQDSNLPLPELGQRWTSLLNLKEGDITATSDNKMVLTPDAAHVTVNELEKVPALTEELVQSNADLAGCKQVTTKQDEVITGLNKQLTDEQGARKADAALAKVQQKKSWIRGFKWGFIGGLVTGLFLGHGV